jgi:signal transduction histidine kinase
MAQVPKATSHTRAAIHPLANAHDATYVARGSLRRRVLIAMLLLITLPVYVTLAFSSWAAGETLRRNLHNQLREKTEILTTELDRQLFTRAHTMRTATRTEGLAETIDQYLRGPGRRGERGPAPLPHRVETWPRDAEGEPVDDAWYVLDSTGLILLEVTAEQVRDDFPRPTPLDGIEAVERIMRSLPDGPFAAEMPLLDPGQPQLLLGCRLPGLAGARGLALLRILPLRPIFEETERLNPTLGQRLVVYSKGQGLLYSTEQDVELEIVLNQRRGEFFVPPPDDRLGVATLGGVRHAIAHGPVPAIAELSRAAGGRRSEWAVIQTLHVEDFFTILAREQMTAVYVGAVMTSIALLLSWWASTRLVNPILYLTEGVRRFAHGDLDYRVSVNTGDELEILALSANDMAENLRKTYQILADRMLELDEKARQLELIHSISHSVNRVLDLDKLFDRILTEVLVHVRAERLSLALLDERRTGLYLDHVYPPDRTTLPKGTPIPLEGSVMGRALHDQTVTIRRLVPEGKYFEDRELYPLGMRVLCIVPLIATNGAVGTLNLATSDPELFQAAEVRMLERIADSLALAVEHSRLFTRVARFAEELERTVAERTRELQTAQAKLVQTEKFAATGAIAAHIGHEVNNPLLIIKNYLKIIEGKVSRDTLTPQDVESARKSLEVIEEEIDRIARIVAQLRQVARPTTPEVGPVNLSEEIHKMTDLFRGTLQKRDIELKLELDESLGIVHASSDSLRQVLINLARNAMDAMEEKGEGTLTIRTQRAPNAPDTYWIEVADTGTGIPREILNRIFDPFFTTKGEGKGTGLGLSVSFALVQAMGGTIEVDTRTGEGTTMRVVLPLRPPTPGSGDAHPTNGQKTAGKQPPEQDIPHPRRGRRIIIG